MRFELHERDGVSAGGADAGDVEPDDCACAGKQLGSWEALNGGVGLRMDILGVHEVVELLRASLDDLA